MSDTIKRPDDCACTLEAGDTDCPVHVLCSNCGEDISHQAVVRKCAEHAVTIDSLTEALQGAHERHVAQHAEIERLRARLLQVELEHDDVAIEARRRGATQATIALVGDDGDVLEEYEADEWCEVCDGPLFYGDDDWRYDTEDVFAVHAHGSPNCVPRTRAYAELEQIAGVHVAVDDGRVVLELLIPGVPSRVQYLAPDAAALLVEHLRIATARARLGARVSNALEVDRG